MPLAVESRGGARGVQQHQCQQSVRPGLVACGVLGQQFSETNRFRHQLFAHQVLAGRGFVSFVEQKIDRLEDSIQPLPKFRASRDLKRNPPLSDFLFGARQALGDRRLGGEKCATDFREPKAAQGL